MGNIWREKAHMYEAYENDEDEANECFWGGKTTGGEAGWGRTTQNHPRIPPVYIEGWKPSSRYWFGGIISSDKKKNKPEIFKKQSCSDFPQETSQPVLLHHLPTWAVQQGKLLFIKRN